MTKDLENRGMRRFSLELPVKLMVTGESLDNMHDGLYVKNICSGGAFIKTESPLPVGTNVSVNLTLPFDELKQLSNKKVNINIAGQVIRSEKKGMALCFEDSYEISSSDMPQKKLPVRLTAREEEILYWIASGASNQEIADKLSIGLSTVKTHIYNLYKKIKVSNRLQAILWRTYHL